MAGPRLISILLPTYARRAGGYLERSIDSVLAQSHAEFELIVADDASSDGSADLIDWYKRQDSRVTHLRFDQRVGLPALTTAEAYLQSSGEFIVATFDDCTLRTTHLEALLGALEPSDAVMAYGQIEAHWRSGGSLLVGQAFDIRQMRVGNNHVPNAAVMLRRTAVEQFGWYDPHVLMKRFSDWDLWLRIGARQPPVFVPAALGDEYGTGLAQSLGESVTVFRDLMLRYSRTERDHFLKPKLLANYDPLRVDVLPNLSKEEEDDLRYLILEHLLSIGDEGELIRRCVGQTADAEAALLGLRKQYLDRRLSIVVAERNEMQLAVLSLAPNHQRELEQLRGQIGAEQGAIEARLATEEFRMEERLIAEREQAERKLSAAFAEAEQHLAQANATLQREVQRRAEAEALLVEEAQTRSDIAERHAQAVVEWTKAREELLRDRANDHEELERRLQEAHRARESAEASLKVAEDRLEDRNRAHEAVETASREALMRALDELGGVRAELSGVRQETQAERSRVQDLVAELSDLQTQLQRALSQALTEARARREEEERFDREREGWHERRRAWENEKAELSERLVAELARSAEAEFRLDDLQNATFDLQGRLAQTQTVAEQIKRELTASGAEKARLREYASALEGHAQNLTDTMNGLMQTAAWRIAARLRNLAITFGGGESKPLDRVPALPQGPNIEEANLVSQANDPITAELTETIIAGHMESEQRFAPAPDALKSRAQAERRELEQRPALTQTHADRPPAVSSPISTARPRRLIAIGDGPIPSIELCINMPLDYLAAEFGLEYDTYYQDAPPSLDECMSASLVILMRVCTPELTELTKTLAKLGVPLIYTTDDDIETLPPDRPIAAHYKAIGAVDNIRTIVSAANLVLVYNASLFSRFRSIQSRVFLTGSVAGVEFYDAFPGFKRSRSEEHEVRIGFSGSPTHEADLAVVAPAILTILGRHENVVFESIGQPVASLRDHPRYRHFESVIGLRAYAQFQHERDWNIGIAPFELNEFNLGKSDNKYRTYGAAGIPAVYTNIAPLRGSVRHGETGFLVENDLNSWVSALDALIRDPALRRNIGAAARRDVRARFGIPVVAHEYYGFYQAAMSGVRVLVVSHLHLPTVHIDIRVPFSELRRQGLLHHRLREINEVTDADIAWSDVMVIVRAVEPRASDLLRQAQERGVKVIYSWDDDFFSVPEEYPDLHAYHNDPGIIRSTEQILSSADLVKASTPRLGEISRRYTDRVMVAPYGFDMTILPLTLEPRTDGRIRIGYYGTLSRGREFECVVEALERVIDEFANVDLEFFGYAPANMDVLDRTTYIPFDDDYEESIRLLARRQWDIGLSPLPINDIAKAKLPTKYRDYGATRAAGIYTDIECYSGVVRDGETGLLAENTADAWYTAISRLVVDQRLRGRISEAAYRDVRDNYGLDVALSAWTDAFRLVGFPIPRQ